ncbi:MAG: sulfatase-like hydrolase/transferase [Planctomycetota bacterium]|jgi:arylsulfatase A-like enzyme
MHIGWAHLFFALLLSVTLHAQSNVLIIVADDVGVDMVGAYGEHPDAPPTPTIDQLASEGMLFRNCWSNPTCSPTRATILTGRYSFRTGIGKAIFPVADPIELSDKERSLADVFPHAYQKRALGKWHLSIDGGDGLTHPSKLGFDTHRGAPWNLPDPAGQTAYFHWNKAVDGELGMVDVYATTDTVNDAIEFIEATPEPWFLYLAFNAAHSPAHKPPHDLHTYQLPPSVEDDLPMHYKAMIQAMDTELGRLFATVSSDVLEQTLIVFVGDNGTAKVATTPPFDPYHAKGSLFEGGINVPLIIKGAGVQAGTECEALVNTVDIYPTVVEHALGTAPASKDGVSMVPYFSDPDATPLRSWVYSESFRPNGYSAYLVNSRAARDVRYKLIRDYGGIQFYNGELMFDLRSDPWETTNLLGAKSALPPGASQAYVELSALLDSMQGPWKDLGDALAGGNGVPALKPDGPLLPGDPVTLRLEGTPPFAPATLFISLETLHAPFKGGVLVPDPSAPGGQLLNFVTGGQGNLNLGNNWPFGVPADVEIFFQFWMQDAGGPVGYSASNAVRALTQ